MSFDQQVSAAVQQAGGKIGRKILMPLLKEVAFWFSVPVETLLHFRFGVRYLGALPVIFSYVVFLFVADYLTKTAAANPELTDHGILPWFGNAFLVVALLHRLYANRLAKQGVLWHSASSGLSFGFWRKLGISDAMAQKFVEPAVVFSLSLIIVRYDTVMAEYLLLSSVALFIKNQIVYTRARNAFLDRQDSRIEAEIIAQMTRSMTTPSLRDAKGFVVPMSFNKSAARSEEDTSIADRLAQIDPALAKYVEQAGDDAGEQRHPDDEDSPHRNSSESS